MKSLLSAYSYKNLCDLEELLIHKHSVNFIFERMESSRMKYIFDIKDWTLEHQDKVLYLDAVKETERDADTFAYLKFDKMFTYQKSYIAAYILELTFKELPLYISSPSNLVQDLVTFRMKRNI